MRVLVATRLTQGTRKNDFFWALEGELVGFAFECDREEVDGACGCKRALGGFESHKATTTVRVIERPDLTIAKLAEAKAASLIAGGWGEIPDVDKLALAEAHEIARIAKFYPVGAVLERRGDEFVLREVVPWKLEHAQKFHEVPTIEVTPRNVEAFKKLQHIAKTFAPRKRRTKA